MTRRPCRGCGHDRAAHDHYRPGTDCSACACRRYRRRLLPRLFRIEQGTMTPGALPTRPDLPTLRREPRRAPRLAWPIT